MEATPRPWRAEAVRMAKLLQEAAVTLADLIDLVDDALDGGTLAASDFTANEAVTKARAVLSKLKETPAAPPPQEDK